MIRVAFVVASFCACVGGAALAQDSGVSKPGSASSVPPAKPASGTGDSTSGNKNQQNNQGGGSKGDGSGPAATRSGPKESPSAGTYDRSGKVVGGSLPAGEGRGSGGGGSAGGRTSGGGGRANDAK